MSRSNGQSILQVGWRPKGTVALKAMGYRVEVLVTAAQRDEGLDELQCADRILFVENFTAIETIIFRMARELLNGPSYQAVIGFDEYALLPASVLAHYLGLTRVEPSLIVSMRDKYVQKRAIRDAGFDSAAIQLNEDILSAVPPSYPFVLKPVAGAATKFTYHIRNDEDWARALAEIRAAVGPRCFVTEQVIDGREYHMDGYLVNGHVEYLTINRYIQNVIKIKEGAICGSISLSPDRDADTYSLVSHWLEQVLGVLGHREGVFHVEAFLTRTGWVFSEAAMRVGGGGIPFQHREIFKFDLFRAFAEGQLHLPIAAPIVSKPEDYSGWVYLSTPAGRLDTYPSEQAIRERNGNQPVEISLLPGQVAGSRSSNSVVRIGVSCLRGSSIDEVEQRGIELAHWFLSEVRVVETGTLYPS